MSLDFAKEVNNTVRIDEHFNKLVNNSSLCFE